MRNNTFIPSAFIVIILLLIVGFFPDESSLKEITDNLKKFTDKYPQEKVHIQTDKPYYIAGEEIYLKAYLVIAKDNAPSDLSKILYLDLINETNHISKKITIAVDSGKAFGNLMLPDTLAPGNYRLRAYTNYMRNFDANFFFEKFIAIGSTGQPFKTNSNNPKESITVQFFPEGGDLIYGLRSKIGVKAVDQNGKGINISGFLEDENGEKVAIISTEHVGIGSFAVNPVKGKTYKVVIEKQNGSKQFFELPKISESGYILAVNNLSNKTNITVKIASSTDLINGKELSLVAQCNGKPYYTTIAKMDKSALIANIPKARFPTGIVQFTLFDGKIPLAERIIFNNHFNQLKINISVNNILGTENKTNLNLLVTDENENPIDGNVSVSVIATDKVPFNEDDETTILSNLLLTSDLKGYIEKPNYYFNQINLDKERQLDNLLLTQGWRRFLWQEVLTDKRVDLNYLAEKSLTIKGTVSNILNQPLQKVRVTLVSVTPGFDMLLDTISDKSGRFYFDRLDVPDTIDFIIQAKTNNDDKNLNLKIDADARIIAKPYIGPIVNMDVYMANAKLQYQNSLNFITTGINLKQVTINKNKQLKPIENVLNSKSRNGSVDYVVSKDRIDHETGSAFNILNGVPGVKMQEGKIIRSMTNTISMSNTIVGKPQPMLILLDGARVEQDVLQTTPASAVEGIEILVSNYNTVIYEDGYWGVILVTTKTGKPNVGSNFINPNMLKVSNKGFAAKKEFYVPAVNVSPTLAKKPSHTSTIYWHPNLNTNIDGKASLNFINPSDNYTVIIEGLDNYGNIGRKIFTKTNNL